MKLALSLIGLGTSKLSPFQDDIAYSLDFVGSKAELNVPGIKYDENDFVVMKTGHNEEYKCYFPQGRADEDEEATDTGSPAEVLLGAIFKLDDNGRPKCSYKLEQYWTYEICHGLHVRQYHDEKIKGGTKTTEYHLGFYNGPIPIQANEDTAPKSRDEVLKKMIDGIETPYYELLMDNGTPCNLKPGKNRISKVQYICNHNAHDVELLSITETRTCEYEIQVLTAALCKSPLYSQKMDTATFGIPCEKMSEEMPTVPTGYKQVAKSFDITSLLKGQYSSLASISITTIDTVTGEIKQISTEELGRLLDEARAQGNEPEPTDPKLTNILENLPADGDVNEIQEHIAKVIMKEVQKSGDAKNAEAAREKIQSAKVVDALKRPTAVLDAETKKILHQFLQGEYCLRGGTGWWKYEFCYGKHVLQYHDWTHEAGKPKRERDEIIVGKWNLENHIDYAQGKTVVKRQKTSMKHDDPKTKGSLAEEILDEDGEKISVWNPSEDSVEEEVPGKAIGVDLFYTDGDICDVTGKSREVIVRLKCKPGASALSLYLLEPKTCSYVLGLESQLLCQLLTDVDDNGLIQL